MERATRGSRGPGRPAPEPPPGIGRKDLPDPDRDLTEPGRPAPEASRRTATVILMRTPDGRCNSRSRLQDNQSPASR
jgi:hypothetical protein